MQKCKFFDNKNLILFKTKWKNVTEAYMYESTKLTYEKIWGKKLISVEGIFQLSTKKSAKG
jgi:hypothetical protein